MPTLAAAPKAVVAAKATAYTSVEGITEYRLPNGCAYCWHRMHQNQPPPSM
jgi:hypothetical protein